MFALAIAGCHKEPPPTAPGDDSCFGAECVEQAEAAMYYKDYDNAREPLTAVCEKNDGFQCFRLAELYQTGKGGPVDLAKAAEVYEKSCAADYPEACERRSDMARDGQGTPQVEYEYAVKACTGGRQLACTHAGQMLGAGRGVEPDPAGAIEMFQKGCKLGDIDGCTGAGDLLLQQSSAEAKSRGLTAFINACVGHSGYGCLKAGIAFHEGVGTKRDVIKAEQHFSRACEFQIADGCHVAQQLKDAAGKPVELELTSKAAELAAGGLETRELSCRMAGQGEPALSRVIAGVARGKDSLDSCAKDGAAVGVRWVFEDGKFRDAKFLGRVPKKLKQCVAYVLRKKAKFSRNGSCEAVLLLGDPEGAAKALAARANAPADDGKVHIRISSEDEE
ncbi:tetratricopeptide repeat protein [Nannocystis pusilla]|uniref:Sel1 repeat family protein n=1 Tax=Nannocystis pusilla TaxID=889268 RepID=A0ABS7U0C7_9BACT|nr:tetratricopeptide repeat protein [Nannocystis pusilla]MBZ5713901.1 sel1 repeat family protein [Nannocystis pusilla]